MVGTTTSSADIDVGENSLSQTANSEQCLAGTIARASFLNFALTDAEILDLATNRLGVLPVKWQRGSMSNPNTSVWTQFAATSFSSGSPTQFSLTSGVQCFATSSDFVAVGGQRYRITATWTGSAPNIIAYLEGSGTIEGLVPVVSGVPFTLTAVVSSSVAKLGFRMDAPNAADFTVTVIPLGALFLQPDSNAGAGPVLRGNYGLPDLILPGDGHTAGGVYRPAPLLSGPVDIEADIAGGSGNSFVLGSDVQRIPPGWAVVQARVFTPSGNGAANITLGTSSGGTQICGSTAISAGNFVTATLASPQPVFATGTRIYINRSATLNAGSRLILTIAPVNP